MDATRLRPRIALLTVLALVGASLLTPAAGALDGDNAPPEAVVDEINTAEGTPGDTDVLANDTDPDDDPLTIVSWTQATYGTVGCGASNCVYTPTDTGFSGTDSFTYTISDGNGGSDVGDVVVTVTPTNEQPVADDDALTTDEDSVGAVNVLDGDTDDDGDPLVVETLAPTADHGTVSCTEAGICTYTPEPNFAGSDTFSYSMNDGQGGSDTGDVAVTVTPVNDDPNAVDDSLMASEGAMASLNVHTNDTDVDGDTLLVTTPSPAAEHGDVSCLGGGGCSYTPDEGYSGPDSFDYTISDGNGGTDSATVTVTVNPGNHAPVADDDALSTAEDSTGAINVLVGDSDADGDTLSVSTPEPTAEHGTVSCASGGVCSYTPGLNYNGTDSFEYTVTDGLGKSDTATVSVTVTPVNDAPYGIGDALAVPEDGQGQVDVLLNDIDIEGDDFSVTDWADGDHGLVACDAGGTCTYTPAADYSGSDTFTYTVTDEHGASRDGSVGVIVAGANDAPVAADDTLTVEVDTPGNVNVLTGDLDVDGDVLTVDGTSDPEHGSVSCDAGVCTYTPDAAYIGPDSFTYTVSDGQATDEGLVTVTVTEANTKPKCLNVVPSKTVLTPPKSQFVAVKLVGATDLDGDLLTYAITTVTQDEKVKRNGADKSPDAKRAAKPEQVNLRAERDPKGNGRVYRIAYTVSDGRGGSCFGVERVGVPLKTGKKAVETAKTFNSFG